MSYIVLNDNDFLGTGGERNCYIYPRDEKKVIKIVKKLDKHNNQNILEYTYIKYLEKQDVDFSYIPKCYGFVNTNFGEGLVVQRIKNYDNSEIRTMSFYIKHNLWEDDYSMKLINDLKAYLFKNDILFVDASLSNIFCQKISKNEYKLIIFDGLGARRPGIKFWLYMKLKFFARYKIKKQWDVFLKNYKYERSLNIKLENKDNIEY
ncbi:MAG: YrbL family protein [Halarcobacter sp.]